METPANNLETLFEKAEAYSKTTFELSKLRSLETIARVAPALISRIGVLIMFALFAMVISIGIALWLGEMLGNPYSGFFIVAGALGVAGILLRIYLYQWIKKPLSNLIITQALK